MQIERAHCDFIVLTLISVASPLITVNYGIAVSLSSSLSSAQSDNSFRFLRLPLSFFRPLSIASAARARLSGYVINVFIIARRGWASEVYSIIRGHCVISLGASIWDVRKGGLLSRARECECRSSRGLRLY